MDKQTTIGRPITVAGPGLHTGRRGTVTLDPAPAGFGRQMAAAGGSLPPVAMTWAHRVPSVMSTSLDLGGQRAVRTIEHLMASLSAFGIDNVAIAIDGPEIPIFDGSASAWCRSLSAAGVVELPAPRRSIRVLKPIQVCRDRGFLRVEPAEAFTIDVTYDLLAAFPVMRWSGAVERRRFERELSRSRSFGRLRELLRLAPKRIVRSADTGIVPHAADATLLGAEPEDVWARLAAAKAEQSVSAPVLRGARPGRAALVVGRTIIGGARYPDEPVRHVALDMIGDLALSGAPLLGHVVAHNPSHEKTYVLVAALMQDPTAWEMVECAGEAALRSVDAGPDRRGTVN